MSLISYLTASCQLHICFFFRLPPSFSPSDLKQNAKIRMKQYIDDMSQGSQEKLKKIFFGKKEQNLSVKEIIER